MPKKQIDLTGMRFGKLVVLAPTNLRRRANILWECLCDCGRKFLACRADLRRGRVRSCGCMKQEPNKIILLPKENVGICLMKTRVVSDYFWFDLQDLLFVERCQWHPDKKGYAYTRSLKADGTEVATHRAFFREVLGLRKGDGILVDHINGDVRDNRRCNLRVCNHKQNNSHRVNVRGYVKTPAGNFAVKIGERKAVTYIGTYTTEAEAKAAYREACVQRYGEFMPHEAVIWFPGHDNDNILNPKNLLDWVDFLHDYAA